MFSLSCVCILNKWAHDSNSQYPTFSGNYGVTMAVIYLNGVAMIVIFSNGIMKATICWNCAAKTNTVSKDVAITLYF